MEKPISEISAKKKGLTVASVISTGTGLIDGFLFVWKIYRKFKKR